MRNAMRIFLVVMLFALAIWSAVSAEADTSIDAMPSAAPAAPSLLIQVDDSGLDVDTGIRRCNTDSDVFSAFDDSSTSTDTLRFASNADSLDAAGANSLSLQRL